MDASKPAPAAKSKNKEHLRAMLAKGQERMREMRAAGWKPVHRNPVEQALDHPTSLKRAIKAHCWVCVGGEGDPGAKFRVRDCEVAAKCPLYSHRPWQTVQGGVRVADTGETEATEESEDTEGE